MLLDNLNIALSDALTITASIDYVLFSLQHRVVDVKRAKKKLTVEFIM